MDFTPKLAAFDLDGTLAESKTPMSADMGALLARLMQKMPVAVLSGGSWKQFQNQFLTNFSHIADLDRLYLLPTNAAVCYVHRGGEWRPRYDNLFSEEEKKKIMDAFAGALAEVQFEQPAQIWGEQLEDRGGEITFSALGQQAPIAEKQKYDPTHEKRRPLYEALKKRLPDFSIGLNATTSIDITPHGIDKAYGMQKLSEITGVPLSKMLYIGDALQEGGNDYAVVKTGVRTQQVSGPEETAKIIGGMLAS